MTNVGKAKAAQNAYKHGFRAEELVSELRGIRKLIREWRRMPGAL